MPGCRITSAVYRQSLTWRRPCAIRCGIGPAWWCSSMTAASRWTPTWSKERSGQIHSRARTHCSQARTLARHTAHLAMSL
jgi:hypothetical protein